MPPANISCVQLGLIDWIEDVVGGDMGDGRPCAVATRLLLYETILSLVELYVVGAATPTVVNAWLVVVGVAAVFGGKPGGVNEVLPF